MSLSVAHKTHSVFLQAICSYFLLSNFFFHFYNKTVTACGLPQYVSDLFRVRNKNETRASHPSCILSPHGWGLSTYNFILVWMCPWGANSRRQKGVQQTSECNYAFLGICGGAYSIGEGLELHKLRCLPDQSSKRALLSARFLSALCLVLLVLFNYFIAAIGASFCVWRVIACGIVWFFFLFN